APVIADCSSCAAHLKTYPQLFLEEPGWKARAEKYSASVRDMIEMPSPPSPCPLPEGEGKGEGNSEVTAFHDSCRARHGQGLIEQGRSWTRWAAGSAAAELAEAGWCCGGAGAFAFTEPELSEEILKRKIANIAATRA